MEFLNSREAQSPSAIGQGLRYPFRITFNFGTSQSELFIKSYGRLKLFCPKLLKS